MARNRGVPLVVAKSLDEFVGRLEEQVRVWSEKPDYDPEGWDRFGDCGATRNTPMQIEENGGRPVFHRYIRVGDNVTGLNAESPSVEVRLLTELIMTEEVLARLEAAGFKFAGVTRPLGKFEVVAYTASGYEELSGLAYGEYVGSRFDDRPSAEVAMRQLDGVKEAAGFGQHTYSVREI